MAEANEASRVVPVLFTSDSIVLPGMVVPIELDDAARAAVDAARASESGELLIAPRLEDRYPSYGVLASIVQVGRVAGGNGTAAVVRGKSRAHIGAGANGPGPALWVEVTEVEEPARPTRPCPGRRVQEAAAGVAAAAGGLADRRLRQPADRPVGAGRHGRLRVVPDAGAEAAAAGDARCRRAAACPDRLDQRPPRRGGGQRQDRRRRPRGHGEDAEGVPAAPAAGGDPQGTRRGRAGRF